MRTPGKSAKPTAAQLQELGAPIEGQVWRICVGCDEAFMAAIPQTLYCCGECRQFYEDQRRAVRAEAA